MTGTRGQSGRDPEDHGIAQVMPKAVPPARASFLLARAAVLLTRTPPVSSVGGVRPLPARPLLRDNCPVSKGLFAEGPAP